MDFLSIPDMAKSHIEVHTFMLADSSDSIEPSKLYGVKEYAPFTFDSPYLLDTNPLIKTPYPLINSHLTNIHANSKIEVIETLLNKVYIYDFNTYKDLKFEEEHYILDDMIIPLSFFFQGSLFGLLEAPWNAIKVKPKIMKVDFYMTPIEENLLTCIVHKKINHVNNQHIFRPHPFFFHDPIFAWHKRWNLKEDEITWWLMLKSTHWLWSFHASG